MAIEFVAKGTFVSSTSGVTLSPPSGYVDGDLFVIFVSSCAATIATPSGWSEIYPEVLDANLGMRPVGIGAFYKIASGTQGNVSIADSGSGTAAIMTAWRNVSDTDSINAALGAASPSTSTTFTGSIITTTEDSAMVVVVTHVHRDADSTANISGWTNASLASITEGHDQSTNIGNGVGIAFAYGIKATKGSINATTATNYTTADWAEITFALKPALATGGGGNFFAFFM